VLHETGNITFSWASDFISDYFLSVLFEVPMHMVIGVFLEILSHWYIDILFFGVFFQTYLPLYNYSIWPYSNKFRYTSCILFLSDFVTL